MAEDVPITSFVYFCAADISRDVSPSVRNVMDERFVAYRIGEQETPTRFSSLKASDTAAITVEITWPRRHSISELCSQDRSYAMCFFGAIARPPKNCKSGNDLV